MNEDLTIINLNNEIESEQNSYACDKNDLYGYEEDEDLDEDNYLNLNRN